MHAPENAKEITMLLSQGLIRHPCLVIKNAEKKYVAVLVFKNKKETELLAILPFGSMVFKIVDEDFKNDEKVECCHNMKFLKVDGACIHF